SLFQQLHQKLQAEDATLPPPDLIAKTYYRVEMRPDEWQKLLALDEQHATEKAAETKTDGMRHRCIYKLWPDFPIKSHTDRSMATVKADAALKSFDASGEGITWAVIDSGIDGAHGHFAATSTLASETVKDLHRCFVEITEDNNGIPVARRLKNPD